MIMSEGMMNKERWGEGGGKGLQARVREMVGGRSSLQTAYTWTPINEN